MKKLELPVYSFDGHAPAHGSRFIAWDSKGNFGLYTSQKPGKDISVPDAVAFLQTLIRVYGLVDWAEIPKAPK